MLTIVVDTREQRPFTFGGFDCLAVRGTLRTGDYSLPGFEDRLCIERKSLDDLVGSICQGRERLERELARMAALNYAAVVCEGSWEDLARGRYRSQMKPKAALQSVLTFEVRYGVPFHMTGSRSAAEYLAFGLLQKFHREHELRSKAEGVAA